MGKAWKLSETFGFVRSTLTGPRFTTMRKVVTVSYRYQKTKEEQENPEFSSTERTNQSNHIHTTIFAFMKRKTIHFRTFVRIYNSNKLSHYKSHLADCVANTYAFIEMHNNHVGTIYLYLAHMRQCIYEKRRGL